MESALETYNSTFKPGIKMVQILKVKIYQIHITDKKRNEINISSRRRSRIKIMIHSAVKLG